MKESTKMKSAALLIKAAFEEGFNEDDTYDLTEAWRDSHAKRMHDQLMVEAKGGLTTKTS